MTDYEIGDKVRITYEGVVTDINGLREPELNDGGHYYVEGSDELDDRFVKGKVEVVEKRKPKVGDVLTGNQVAEWDAPLGTLIVDDRPLKYGKQDDYYLSRFGGWITPDGARVATRQFRGFPHFRVVYLPD